jgi:hypothetical protein
VANVSEPQLPSTPNKFTRGLPINSETFSRELPPFTMPSGNLFKICSPEVLKTKIESQEATNRLINYLRLIPQIVFYPFVPHRG